MIDRDKAKESLIQSMRWVFVGAIVGLMMSDFESLSFWGKMLLVLIAVMILWVLEYQLLEAEDLATK
ncbi:hypothetical protein C478_10548 [Natrinema thermotolerans DSM 11552]|nr:hypothetical protein C478_10548 [Natrinema thermotolerans DSM 11552]